MSEEFELIWNSGKLSGRSRTITGLFHPHRSIYLSYVVTFVQDEVSGRPILLDVGTPDEPEKFAADVEIVPDPTPRGSYLYRYLAGVEVPPENILTLTLRGDPSADLFMNVRYRFQARGEVTI